MAEVKSAAEAKTPNYKRGYLFALGAVVVAIVLWVIIWKMGFIASLVAFAMAWGVSFLYQKGAGADVDKKSSVILIIMIVVGLVIAFAAGMVSDAYDAYKSVVPDASLFDSGFHSFFSEAMSDSAVIGAYTKDMAMALVFGALGSYGIIKDLIARNKGEQKPAVKS